MNIPPKCEDLHLKIAKLERLLREAQAAFNYNPEGSCHNPGMSFVKPWSIKVAAALERIKP